MFSEVLWTLGAWFGSLKMQGGAQFHFVGVFCSTPAPFWRSLRGVGWMEGAGSINSPTAGM